MDNKHVSKPLACKATNRKNTLLNVILITLDAFNYELFVENLEHLPNLAALKGESAFFKNAFSVGPSTFFAFPGIIASVYPYHFGIGIHKSVKAIDRVLKDCGYNTAQINDLNVLLTAHFGYGTNTDYIKHILNLPNVEKHRAIADTLLGKGDEEEAKRHLGPPHLLKKIYDKVDIKWIRNLEVYWLRVYRFLRFRLKEQSMSFHGRQKLYGEFRNEVLEFINGKFESPQFLWIHTCINHLPYFPPENSNEFDVHEIDYLNYRGLSEFVNPRICERLKRLYVESMKTTDKFIGDIVDALSTNGLLDNSIIVITADHGEEFMERGYFGHSEDSSSDRLLHVPLIFCGKSILEPRSISAPVSTLDILPTICDLLGIGIPDSARGLSLKETLLNNTNNSKDYQELWQRPLFSEGWESEGLLTRSSGHESNKKIFTVRKGPYKLKVLQEQRTDTKVVEKLELINWVSNEELDVKSNRQILEYLNYLLHDHIYKEGIFAKRIKNEAETRRIKDALGRMRNKL